MNSRLVGPNAKYGWPAASDDLEAGRARIRELACMRPGPIVVALHGDADGLASAKLMGAALQRLDGPEVEYVVAGRAEHAHTASMRDRLRLSRPTGLVVLDMGSRRGRILSGVPTLVVDHHPPDGVPSECVFVNGFDRPPVAPTTYLTYTLTAGLVDVADLDWVLAIGMLGDLGSDRLFPDLRRVVARHGRARLAECVALLNAGKRSPRDDAMVALDVLLRARVAADIADRRLAGADRLQEDRRAVQAELARCARTPPRFSRDGTVALIRFASAAQVHTLLAQRWVARLKKQIVIAANDGYSPGRVHFAVRSVQQIDLRARMRSLSITVLPGDEFGHGHPQATGGIVSSVTFERILDALGFAPVTT